MEEIEKVLKKIEELRNEMEVMISTRCNLLDNEIFEISKLLDEQLVVYCKLLKQKKG